MLLIFLLWKWKACPSFRRPLPPLVAMRPIAHYRLPQDPQQMSGNQEIPALTFVQRQRITWLIVRLCLKAPGKSLSMTWWNRLKRPTMSGELQGIIIAPSTHISTSQQYSRLPRKHQESLPEIISPCYRSKRSLFQVLYIMWVETLPKEESFSFPRVKSLLILRELLMSPRKAQE